MEPAKGLKEKRKHPRVNVNLPLEYWVSDAPKAQAGMAINASESGLLLHSLKDMPVGAKLNISILFSEGFELGNIEVHAEIVWKTMHQEEKRQEYQYGLKFIDISDGNLQKLKRLLVEER